MNTNDTLVQASLCRQAGITMVTVAAGSWIDAFVLSSIASYPYTSNTIIASDYGILSTQQSYASQIANIICNSE
jgi:hypothetical protein